MFDPVEKTPRVFMVGNKVHSDNCIWCGNNGVLSETHLFPQSIGGRFAPSTACKECNNFLGWKFESTVKRNAFMTAALVKLGISDKREAYRFAKKIDESTGLEMHIAKNGNAKAVPRVLGDGRFVGTPQEIKDFNIARFKNRFPNWDTKPLEEFYNDPARRTLIYAGLRFTQVIRPPEEIDLRIDGLLRDPDPFLVFKIICEFLAVPGLNNHEFMRKHLTGLVNLNTSSNRDRIRFSSKIPSLFISNTANTFQEYKRLEEVPFKPFHYIIIRLSVGFRLYIEVGLFGVLRNFFIVGKLGEFDDRISPLIDEAFIFPLHNSAVYQQRYHNLVGPDHTKWADAAVELRIWELTQSIDSENISSER